MTEIVERATKDLVPYARNPGKDDAAVDQMAASIREFGFKVSVAVKEGPKRRATFRPLEDSVPAWVSGVKAKPSAHLRAALTSLTGRKCLALTGDIGPPKWPPF